MKYLLILLVFLSFTGQAQKKLLKEATTLEASEQYTLASEKYREVLYKNSTKAEAIAGLKRTAQRVIDEKLSSYFILRNSGELKNAVSTFETILSYQEELKYFNIQAQIPPYYFSDYEADKKQIQIEEESATVLAKNQQDEKLYLEAIGFFNQSRWVKAWHTFNSIPYYKEASDYLGKIESKALRIALLENNKNKLSHEDVFRNNLLSEIIKLSNPLIRIVNRDNLDQLIDEQKLGLTGLMDEQSAAELGKLLGVELVLLTRILDYNMSAPERTNQSKTAYIVSVSQVHDPVTQTTNAIKEYYPVSYDEYSEKSRLEISIQYQLIDVSTAEILTAEVVHEYYDQNIRYASYQGDPTSLYPSDGQSIFTKGKKRADFLALFSIDSRSMSQKEMESELQRTLSRKVAKSLDVYFSK